MRSKVASAVFCIGDLMRSLKFAFTIDELVVFREGQVQNAHQALGRVA